MRQKKQTDRIGATPGKLALIGVLAIVLVFVIVRQLPSSKQADAPATRGQAAQTKKTTSKRVASVSGKNSKQRVLRNWPKTNLTTTLLHDPFAPPSWIAQEKRIKTPSRVTVELAELKQQGTAIVVISDNFKAATIGTQQFRVGDMLEGFTVTDITNDGILLDKLSP